MMQGMKAHQRKNGLWEVKGVDPNTGRRKSYYGSCPEEALSKANGSKGYSLIQFYESAWLPTIRHLSPGTVALYVRMFESHIAPALGDTDIRGIDRAMLQRHFNGLGSLSPRSLQLVRIVLGSILKLAEQDEQIGKNPCKNIRLPRPMPTRKKALSAEDLRLLVENSGSERELVLLCGCAGLRRGEALAIGAQDIKSGVLSVDSQIVSGRGRTMSLKTESSYREIPIPFDLPKKPIFTTGEPNAVSMRIKRLGIRLGLGPITPHTLRHTFITILEDELECPRRVVAELAGHKRSSVTDVYSRVSMEQKRKWMERLWNHVSTSRTTIHTTKEA